jgi:hypothetical protein
MNIFVLLTSAAFVATGCFLLWSGKNPAMAWGTVIFFGGGMVIAAWDVVQTRMRRLVRPDPIDPDDCFQPFVVKRSVGFFVVYFAGSACFACAGALLAWIGKAPIFGWAAAVFFGAGAVVTLVKLLDPRPRLVIDADGLLDRTLGVGRILWSDIERAYLRSVEGFDFICLVVRDPSVYLDKLSPVRRKLAGANLALGFTQLNLSLAGLKARPEDLLRLIAEQIKEHDVDHESAGVAYQGIVSFDDRGRFYR